MIVNSTGPTTSQLSKGTEMVTSWSRWSTYMNTIENPLNRWKKLQLFDNVSSKYLRWYIISWDLNKRIWECLRILLMPSSKRGLPFNPIKHFGVTPLCTPVEGVKEEYLGMWWWKAKNNCKNC